MSTPDTTTSATAPHAETTGRTKAVRALAANLAEARQLAPLMADPLLNAVKVERLRVSVTRCLWFFLACGLGYTTEGVHAFLAHGADMTAPRWWAAWLVEPAFAGILVTLLRWEAEMLARGLHVTATAVRHLKRLLLFATTVMNVIPTLPFFGVTFHAGNFFVHLIIPLIVFLLAEVMPAVQQMCTDAKTTATLTTPVASTAPVSPDPVPPATHTPAPAPEVAPAPPPQAPAPAPAPRPAPTAPTAPVAPAVPGRVRLPDELAAKVAASIASATAAGRTPTVADVQAVVRVTDAIAARVLADHTTPATNGHPAA